MQLPETPRRAVELDLMQRLKAYANGDATWLENGVELGAEVRQACTILHTNLVQFIELVSPILDRSTAREMRMFTMHDHTHAIKVAHIMWHILKPTRRERLTASEIGLLIASAYFHDLGMALSDAERDERLAPESDLWLDVELNDAQKQAILKLEEQSEEQSNSEVVQERAQHRLNQALEVLLCYDTRKRHAKRERYLELFRMLHQFHEKDPAKIVDLENGLTFDGDSFRDKLIDICESHNQDVGDLISRYHFERPVFAHDYPVGRSTADLHMIAAALRLADILDFDRERTPPVMFHYLLPGTLGLEDRSVLEWSKHLTISNWHIETEEIVFRGRSRSHIVHHAVVQFCEVISRETTATKETFAAIGREDPFALPTSVRPDIHAEGYHYIPYKFELDDERVYELLMGEAIYNSPLAAVRELIQNAVDACKLRDAWMQHEDGVQPNVTNRIIVRYEEPTGDEVFPSLIVVDTGTGMDGWIIERYFLQVGQSYYRSSEFNRERLRLQRQGLDFAPVSEFGIGFLSSFLLADKVFVETAMWEAVRGDTRKRTLEIDGPTRLIRLDIEDNQGIGRFKGTKITLVLSRGASKKNRNVPASWEQIRRYIRYVCQDLPYELDLQYVSIDGRITSENVPRRGTTVALPPALNEITIRIPVRDLEIGLEGEITLTNPSQARKLERESSTAILLKDEQGDSNSKPENFLLRGGFVVGHVRGLPSSRVFDNVCGARIRLTWADRADKRYVPPNLSRDSLASRDNIEHSIQQCWFTYILLNRHNLPEGLLDGLTVSSSFVEMAAGWLEEQFDALSLYELARYDWTRLLIMGSRDTLYERKGVTPEAIRAWELGQGESLWLSNDAQSSYLCCQLLNTLLPGLVELQVNSRGMLYVKPPSDDIQSLLKEARGFISSGNKWGYVAEFLGDRFQGKFEALLCYRIGSFEWFNSRYADRLVVFTDDERVTLLHILTRAFDARLEEKPWRVTVDEYNLFMRAKTELADLEVGNYKQEFSIASFTVSAPTP